MNLTEYQRKRHFRRTTEPAGKVRRAKSPSGSALIFVVQKHSASRSHYDLRLEVDGVLKSWAVPKGPSLNPAQKRLAVAVEDHPLEYATFEGTIPAGQYGAGEVIVWDRGTWIPEGDPHESLRDGKLEFELQGEKLAGSWRLIRLDGRAEDNNWLLIKRRDVLAREQAEITETEPASVLSHRTLEELASGKKPSKKPLKKARKKSAKAARPKSNRRASATAKRSAKSIPAPEPVAPQLARIAARPPSGENWIHEIKYDGYRLLGALHAGSARLFTRNQLDWTHRFPTIAAAVAELPAESALLDGEVVALEENGVSNFQALQNSLQGEPKPLVYYGFDLLQLDGEDLSSLPLLERKSQLKALLPHSDRGRIRFSEHLSGDGKVFLQHCCQLGLEGIISKRADRPYTSGRTEDWLKIKCLQEEEFVIGGFTISPADKRGFGALLLGYFQGRKLVYAGRVGTGFSAKLLKSLREELEQQRTADCPFDPLPARERGAEVQWVRPALVAQIQFTGWTQDKLLRHPSFLGLREDKTARAVGVPESLQLATEVRLQSTAEAQTAPRAKTRRQQRSPKAKTVATQVDYPLTNPDRLLYPKQGITKLHLATYYHQVAAWMLPYLADRPLSLLRCPEGQAKSCFFQKHAAAGTPPALRRIEVPGKDGPETYLIADDLPGLLSLAQMGVLEIHVWGSRTDRLDYPDWLVLDLDPAPDVAWKRVVDTAIYIHDWLARLKLQTFVKCTGGKGLHVVVPLAPRRADWDKVKSFAKSIAQSLAERFPDRYIAKMSKAARRGKIFIDYLRNDRGATAIAPYSTRAKESATVALPLTWSELTSLTAADQWTIAIATDRLRKIRTDPWSGFFELRQRIPKSLVK